MHHIVPESLGGSDDCDNLVMLSPKQHAVAHELLFRHFMRCAENMARAYACIMSGTGAKAAKDIPDEYCSSVLAAYEVMRKRTVLSIADMSACRIGRLDPLPDGYVEKPNPPPERKVSIKNLETGKVFRKWDAEIEPPAGWKTIGRADAEKRGKDERRRLFTTKRSGKSAAIYAYDPKTLRTERFTVGGIPDGWVAGDLRDGAKILRLQADLLMRKAKAANAAVAKNAADALERVTKAISLYETGRLALPDILADPVLCGMYSMDGLTLSLNAWSKRLGVSAVTLSRRIWEFGWDFKKAAAISAQEAQRERLAMIKVSPIRAARRKAQTIRLEDEKLKKAVDAERRREEAERALLAALEEFNNVGWAEFMRRHGK